MKRKNLGAEQGKPGSNSCQTVQAQVLRKSAGGLSRVGIDWVSSKSSKEKLDKSGFARFLVGGFTWDDEEKRGKTQTEPKFIENRTKTCIFLETNILRKSPKKKRGDGTGTQFLYNEKTFGIGNGYRGFTRVQGNTVKLVRY